MEKDKFNFKIDGEEYLSLRFYPFWDLKSITQFTGLIDLIQDINKLGENLKGVEIGSYIGESSLIFLSFHNISKLTCVDIGYHKLFHERLDTFIKNKKCVFMEMSSSNANQKIIEDDFDFIYIDGDHTYDFVKNDIEIWYPKVKKGGILCGHDYFNDSVWSVKKVVDEFVLKYNLDLKIYDDTSWSVIKK